MSDEAIGMMDKAYFVGKVAIIEWLNDLLQVSTKQSTPQGSSLTPLFCVAAHFEDRGVRDGRCLLRSHGLPLPGIVPLRSRKVGRQARTRIRRQLQGTVGSFPKERNQASHRRCEAC